MRVTLIAELLVVLLTAGCAGVESPPPVAPPGPPAPNATQSGAATGEPASAPATPSTSASIGKRDIKAPPPVAKAAPSPPAVQGAKRDTTAPDVAKPKAPPLDLASLEVRLKETSAIGVLTKIALKNQVDDLLDQFRNFYQGKLKTTLAELRQPYDLLVLKVLSLLQDSDPALASAIAASREAIWGVLSDRAKFAAI
jgi:hypothetical protein